jgi:hypothetical protein
MTTKHHEGHGSAGRAEHVLTLGLQLARAGQYTPAGDLLPLYIRRPEPEEKWEARHGAAPPQAF